MWNTLRDDRYKIYNACNGVSCSNCPLHGIGCSEPLSSYEIVEIIKKWSEQHPKKYKVSKLEYDILEENLKWVEGAYYLKFYDIMQLVGLLKKGYFNGATREMNVKDYFDNCEVE